MGADFVGGVVCLERGLPHELVGDPRLGPDFSLWRRIGAESPAQYRVHYMAQNRAIEFIN
jgi:hypothetical protein